MTEEQPLTEAQQSLKETIDRQVQAVMMPAVEQAHDVGGITALRFAQGLFKKIAHERQGPYTLEEVVATLQEFEQIIDPTGECRAIVAATEAELAGRSGLN